MADPKIRIRRSATPNKVPSTTQLQLGELAINTYDGKVYLEQDQGGVGVGTTVIAVNPWSVGIGSTAYNTHFTAGKVGVGTTNAQYNLDIGGNVNFTGNLYQDGSLYTSGTTGVGIRTAGGIVGYAATILDFRGPGVTTAYYSSATGIGTINFHSVTSGGGGNASVTVSDSAPSSPSNGDLWFKSNVGELYLWYTDGSSNQWVEASGGSNTVVTSDTPPPSPNDGDLWWNSNTGELKIYYNDGNSSQWVDANSEGGFVQYWTQTNTNGTLGVTTTSYVGIGTTTATDALTVTGNVNVSGAATISGNLNVGGVLTYEDVKNVDAIGVVTARTGLKVLAGGANIVDGTTTDELNVTGVSTVTGGVKVGTAATICSEGNMTIDRPSAGIITATKFIGDGSDLTGVISGIGIGTAGGVVGYAATIVHFKGAGVTTAYYNASTGIGTVFFHSAGGGGSANVTIADAPPSSPTAGDLWWESDIGELKIYYSDGDSSQWVDASGADSLVQIGTSAPTGAVSGDLWWNSESGDLMVYYTDANSSAWISVNAVNSERIWATNSTGINTTRSVGIGTTTVTDALTVVGATDLDGRLIVSGITTFGSHVYHGDSDHAIFGDGSDLRIYHDTNNSRIENNTGQLKLRALNSGTSVQFIDHNDNAMIEAVAGGVVSIAHNNSVKFSTTTGGVKVWGTVGSANTALVVVGDARITGIVTVGTGSLKITDRDINAPGIITATSFKSTVSTGTAPLVVASTTRVDNLNADLLDGRDSSSSGGANKVVITDGSGHTSLGSGNITAGGGQFSGNVNVLGTLTYEDVKNVDSAGIATARQGLRITGGGLDVVGVSTFNDNVKLLDNDLLQIGTGQDLSIYHDGSNTYQVNNTGSLVHRSTGEIFLQSDAGVRLTDVGNNETFLRCIDDGAVELYYNGAKTVETTVNALHLTGNASESNIKLMTSDGTQRAFIGATNGNQVTFYNGTSEKIWDYTNNGPINLYHDNAKKLSTQSDGITIHAAEGTSAAIAIVADEGDDNGDTWEIRSNQDVNDLTFKNDTSGSLADIMTLTKTGTLTATAFVGDGSNLTGITQTTINNNANDRIITGSGTANTLNAESGLTFDSSNGNFTNAGQSNSYFTTKYESNYCKVDLRGPSIANSIHYIISYGAGHTNANEFHMVNKSGDDIVFRTSTSATERLRLQADGKLIKSGTNINLNSAYIDFSGSISTPSTAAAIYRPADNSLAFSTANTERLLINNNGLTLNGGKIYGDNGATNVLDIRSTSGNSNHARIEIGTIQSSDNGGIHFYTAGSSAATRYMTLKGGGNLGIGEDNPSHKLNIKNAAACIVQVESTDNNTSSIIQLLGKTALGVVRTAKLAYDNADQVRLITPDAIPLCFLTQNGERLRIEGDGAIKNTYVDEKRGIAPIYRDYVTLSTSWQNIARITGYANATMFRFTFEGQASGAFWNGYADIMVGHYRQYKIKLHNGGSIPVSVRLFGDGSGTCDLQVKAESGNSGTMGFNIIPTTFEADGTIVFTNTGTMSDSNLEIQGILGTVSKSYAAKADDFKVWGSIQSGSGTEPAVLKVNSSGRVCYFEHYFNCVKGGSGNSHTVDQDLVTFTGLGNFHQAHFTADFGVRLQGSGDDWTRPALWQSSINRFNGASSFNINENWLNGDSNVQTYADLHISGASSTSYRVRLEWKSGIYGSSFATGRLSGYLVNDSIDRSNITFGYGFN